MRFPGALLFALALGAVGALTLALLVGSGPSGTLESLAALFGGGDGA